MGWPERLFADRDLHLNPILIHVGWIINSDEPAYINIGSIH